jgi:DNA-binding MarR family transcriptional regulator
MSFSGRSVNRGSVFNRRSTRESLLCSPRLVLTLRRNLPSAWLRLKFTPPQAGILGVISRQNGLSQQALAELLGMFPSRLVLMLDELEQTGLIERRPDNSDRRVYALRPPQAGRRPLPCRQRPSRRRPTP